jgi:hypothetical protein
MTALHSPPCRPWLPLRTCPSPLLPPPLPPLTGKALDCASVGVYTLDQGSGMAGLMLSTEYDTPGAE